MRPAIPGGGGSPAGSRGGRGGGAAAAGGKLAAAACWRAPSTPLPPLSLCPGTPQTPPTHPLWYAPASCWCPASHTGPRDYHHG